MVLYLLLQLTWLSMASVASMVLPGCPERCGEINVPYPFGFRQGCYKNETFQMVCNDTIGLPRLFTRDSGLEVLNISSNGKMHIGGWASWDCYSRPGVQFDQFNRLMDLKEDSPYTFSSTGNSFVAIGCNTSAYIGVAGSFKNGCTSSCQRSLSATDISCSGTSCCQTGIPTGLKTFDVRINSTDNHTRSWAITPCNYAFLVASQYLDLTVSDILNGDYLDTNSYKIRIELDWRIGKETCDEVERDPMSYGCIAANSTCIEPLPIRSGYICQCPRSGNPYIINGCSGKYAFCSSLVLWVTGLSHRIQNSVH